MPVPRFTLSRFASFLVVPLFLIAAPLLTAQQETVLYSFNSSTTGAGPYGNLVFDGAGNLFGANTWGGGSGCYGTGCGTIFELVPQPGGGWQEITIHNFNDSTTDGENPYGTLILDSAGNLYGTARYGGANSCGIVFQLVPRLSGVWKENILRSFSATIDGCAPYAGVIMDASGNLYGTTSGGGAYSWGTVFELSPRAGHSWTPKVLHAFGKGNDGWAPMGGLVMDASGNLYGTTEFGGNREVNDEGTVFELFPQATGPWKEKILANFGSVGSLPQQPQSSLAFDQAGVNLYGTSYSGGKGARGTVFELAPSAGGRWGVRVLHSFQTIQNLADGSQPAAGVTVDAAGNLYGTTTGGGGSNQSQGTVFKLMPGSGGEWTESILYVFTLNSANGATPYAGVVLDSAGNLYGTAEYGGAYLGGGVFEITP